LTRAVAIAQSIVIRTPAQRSTSRITRDVTVSSRKSTPSSGAGWFAISMTRAATVASSFEKFRARVSASAVGRRASNAARSMPPLRTNWSAYGEALSRANQRSTT
jgi:hypothetical protein